MGDNGEGQLGNGKRTSYESTPQKIAENVVHSAWLPSKMMVHCGPGATTPLEAADMTVRIKIS